MRISESSKKLPQSPNLLFKKKIMKNDHSVVEKNQFQNRRKKRHELFVAPNRVENLFLNEYKKSLF